MAIRDYGDGRTKYPGLVYLLRPTKGKKSLVFNGNRYYKVEESLNTEVAYHLALAEKAKGKSVVWTGERIKVRGQPRRTYGVFVRKHKRRA